MAILLVLGELRQYTFQQEPICEESVAKKEPTNKNNSSLLIPHSSWCPLTSCGSGKTTDAASSQLQFCSLCQHRFLILLTMGRSASTTLTWTLDALPGLRMGGENNGAVNRLQDVIQATLLNPHFERNSGTRNTPWGHGGGGDDRNTTTTNVYCAAQDFVRALYPPYYDDGKNSAADDDDVIGFKTIRFLYGHNALQDADYLHFFTNTFPCARFVVNVRSDVDALQESRQAAFHSNRDNADTLRGEIQRLLALAELLGPERSYVLDSTEWTQNATQLNGLVRWLGYSPECDFTEVLELNTVSQYGNGKSRFEGTRSPDCRYIVK